jgi:hypothetical protein
MFLALTALLSSPAHAEWNQLYASRAEATSFLKSNFNKYNENYHPNYVLDGDPKTAWVEGVSGQGVGEKLRIPVSHLDQVSRVKIRIRNGYHKSDNLLVANSAPRQLTVSLTDHDEVVATGPHELDRAMGWQEIVVDVPAGKGLDAVVLAVDSVHPGSTYKDTCISDVEVFVDSSVAYNAGAEKAKAASLQEWVSGRLQEAAYFKSRPADYPFASEHFVSTREDGVPTSEFEAAAAPLRERTDKLGARSGWYRGDGATTLVMPDNLPGLLDDVAPLLAPAGLSWFEATKRVRSTEGDEWYKRTFTNYKLHHANDGDRHPKAVWWQIEEVVQERGVYENKVTFLVALDDEGRPATIWRHYVSDGEPWIEEEIVRLKRGADGKINGVVHLRQSHEIGQPAHSATRTRYEPE